MICLGILNSKAQNCNTDELLHLRKMSDANYRHKAEQSQAIFNELLNVVKNQANIRSKRTIFSSEVNNVAVIPIVIHLCNYGEPVGVGTNFSDEEVHRVVDEVNKLYSNKYLNSTNMYIQFQLVDHDPDGNLSNGIDRINIIDRFPNKNAALGVSLGSEDPNVLTIGDLASSVFWPKTSYYNILVAD